jgi:cell shape-determining protein MreC
MYSDFKSKDTIIGVGGLAVVGGILSAFNPLLGIIAPALIFSNGLLSISELRKKEEEILKYKEALKQSNLDAAKKQTIIKNLHKQNIQLKKELELEKKKNRSNAEKINLLERMIRECQ